MRKECRDVKTPRHETTSSATLLVAVPFCHTVGASGIGCRPNQDIALSPAALTEKRNHLVGEAHPMHYDLLQRPTRIVELDIALGVSSEE